MERGDVSFTFLHRVNEIKLNIEDGRWQSALALALTLPDICGGIAFPELVKRYRDGRVMLDKQKNPTRDVGAQYIRWFDEYAAGFFKAAPGDEQPYICGERCWQLRCEYLHQNKGFLNDENEDAVHFHLGVNCGTSLCELDKTRRRADRTDIRIDIEQFCLRMCQAAKSYYDQVHREKNFNLYNTPVLDFIQVRQRVRSDDLMIIMHGNGAYAGGIKKALGEFPGHILCFSTWDEKRKKLGNRKPSIWILSEKLAEEADPNGKFLDDALAILLIKEGTGKAIRWGEKAGCVTLPLPLKLESLRKAVKDYLKQRG